MKSIKEGDCAFFRVESTQIEVLIKSKNPRSVSFVNKVADIFQHLISNREGK